MFTLFDILKYVIILIKGDYMKDRIIFLKNNLKWIIALVSLILFFLIIRSIYRESIITFDNFYYDNIRVLISDRMTFFVKMVTSLGSAIALISLTVLIMLIFKNKKYGILTGVNLLVIFLFNLLLKFIFARPRPIDINLIEESGYSFPSAHAMVSTAFYGFFVYLICKTKLSKKLKWFYSIILSILIIFICITRVYLGVHYASDVFGGVLLSIAYLVLFTSIISKYLSNEKSSKK